MYMDDEDVYETVGDRIHNSSGSAGSSRVLDFGSIFHICHWRDWFDSFVRCLVGL
jgi:hypothetical protein